MFVEQPPGFEVKDKDGGDLVMQLEKSLYGLAQSPGNWFHTVDPVLVEIGFVPLKSDTCVYLYDHDGVRIYLTLYVCLLYTSPSPRDKRQSRMPSSA